MQSKTDNQQQGQAKVSRWLAAILPFEHVWVRYVCCVWLAVGVVAALWALFVVQPETDALLARSAYLLELEEDQRRARVDAAAYDLPVLRRRADSARARLHSDASSLDRSIVGFVEQLERKGWSGVVAGVERDTKRSDEIDFASYRLEFKTGVISPMDEPQPSQSSTADILSFLQAVAASERQVAIDHLEILSEGGQAAKVFATLSAAIAK